MAPKISRKSYLVLTVHELGVSGCSGGCEGAGVSTF